MARKKILLVDDDDVLRRILAVTLGDDTVELGFAADGEEAIAVAREFKPDLVLLDVMMPNVDGFRVCETIKREVDTRHAWVIMLTARTSEQDRACARNAGADEYFGKPFSPTQLLNRVDDLFEGSNSSKRPRLAYARS